MLKILLTYLLMIGILVGCTIEKPEQNTSEQNTDVTKENAGHKVVVMIVDTLMDQSLKHALQQTQLPAFRFLLDHGHYIPDAVASFPSMTVSDLNTVLTGEFPERHHVPALVWFDWNKKQIVNYGNNARQAFALGIPLVGKNALYDLNQTHLSKHVRTIFEELQDSGYTTGAINMLVYRGKSQHELTLPAYLRPIMENRKNFQVTGPNLLVLGKFTEKNKSPGNDVFHNLGLNDEVSINTLVTKIKNEKLPDFTMVYLPDNDRQVHKKGIDDIKGIAQVDKNLQKVLAAYGDWSSTLKHMALIVMGDSGASPVVKKNQNPTIFLRSCFPNRSIYSWGTKLTKQDDLALAVNSRMAFVYLLNPRLTSETIVNQFMHENRIETIAWLDRDAVYVTTPVNQNQPIKYRKAGARKDIYGQTWDITGNEKLLDLTVGKDGFIKYGKYPDVLQQLWSALHSHNGNYIVVTAKKGYQFGDHQAPLHNGGAQQASLLKDDVCAPLIITGTDQLPKSPVRFVDLKAYFISLVKSQNVKR